MINHRQLILIIILIGAFWGLQGCVNSIQSPHLPKAESGVIDLSNWNFEQDGNMNLSGDWEFYWQRLYNPESLSSKLEVQKQFFQVHQTISTSQKITST